MDKTPVNPYLPPASLPPQFGQVPIYIYRPGEIIDREVYFYHQRNYILFKKKHLAWSLQDLERLKTAEIENLFIRFTTPKEHRTFLEEKLSKILLSNDVPIEHKAHLLSESAEPLLSNVFSSPQSTEFVSAAAEYTKSCIIYLREQGSMAELVKLSQKSLTEYTHSLHVATYAISLAKKSNEFRDQKQLMELGLCALLHDIGKSQIPEKILSKTSDLTNEEWHLMRRHPELGAQILSKQNLPASVVTVALQHHERMNGRGYPRGVKDSHPFSRLVAIADIFNTAISDKPYGTGMPPFTALQMMIDSLKFQLDQDLLAKFILLLSMAK